MRALLALALVFVSTPLFAAGGNQRPVAEDLNRMICRHVNIRRSETRMGTRRVCRTAADWRRLQEYGDPTGDQSAKFHDLREVAGRHSRPN
jgi:hypothetical protein